MSVSMTLDAVRARTKTVTRRHVETWESLSVGERLTLIEKGMGLPKGAKQVVVAEVQVVDVRVETLRQVTAAEVRAEGLWARAVVEGEAFADYLEGDDLAVLWFRAFWAAGHLGGTIEEWAIGWRQGSLLGVGCRRIEWVYLADDLSGYRQRHLLGMDG
jgi:hypothetical protein